ncbi:MAG: CBS domain-containing protein [Planctomycetaceae bacterium]
MVNVEQVMIRDVLRVRSDIALANAARILLKFKVPELFVVDEQDHLIGVLPDYVLLRTQLSEPFEELTVASRATTVSYVLRPEDTLVQAAQLLRLNVHRSLPVVSEKRVLGVVTRRVVLRHLMAPELRIPQTRWQVPRPQFLAFSQFRAARKTSRSE